MECKLELVAGSICSSALVCFYDTWRVGPRYIFNVCSTLLEEVYFVNNLSTNRTSEGRSIEKKMTTMASTTPTARTVGEGSVSVAIAVNAVAMHARVPKGFNKKCAEHVIHPTAMSSWQEHAPKDGSGLDLT